MRERQPSVTDVLGYTPKRIRRVSKHYRSGYSLLWLACYLSTGEKTFLNATQSAIAAGHTGPNPTQSGRQQRLMWQPVLDEWLDEVGLSEAELKTRLLALTNAKETKFIKVKGAVNPDHLDSDARVVAVTGELKKDNAGGHWYGDGETLLAVEADSLAIQTKNLETAIKVKGMIKPPVLELAGFDTLVDDILRARERVSGKDTKPDPNEEELDDAEAFNPFE